MKWFHSAIQLLYHHKLHILEQALDLIRDSKGGYVEAVDFVGTRFELEKYVHLNVCQTRIPKNVWKSILPCNNFWLLNCLKLFSCWADSISCENSWIRSVGLKCDAWEEAIFCVGDSGWFSICSIWSSLWSSTISNVPDEDDDDVPEFGVVSRTKIRTRNKELKYMTSAIRAPGTKPQND